VSYYRLLRQQLRQPVQRTVQFASGDIEIKPVALVHRIIQRFVRTILNRQIVQRYVEMVDDFGVGLIVNALGRAAFIRFYDAVDRDADNRLIKLFKRIVIIFLAVDAVGLQIIRLSVGQRFQLIVSSYCFSRSMVTSATVPSGR
jgi:hypothetical protein